MSTLSRSSEGSRPAGHRGPGGVSPKSDALNRRFPALGGDWEGMEQLEKRLLLSIDLAADIQGGIVDGLNGLSDWGDNLDSSGLMAELLPLVDQDHNQPPGGPQDPDQLLTIGNTLDVGGIIDELRARSLQSFNDHGDPTTSADLAADLAAMTVGDGAINITVTDTSAGNEAVFEVVLTRTRADVEDIHVSLGHDAEELGLLALDAGVTVDLTPELVFDFTFGYHTAQGANADDGFWVDIDDLTASADIDDGAGQPVALPDFDLTIGVLGTGVSGATAQLAAGVQAAFTGDIAGDGEVTLAEFRDSFDNDQVRQAGQGTAVLTASPNNAMVLSGVATFTVTPEGVATATVTVAPDNTNTSLDGLVADVQASLAQGLTDAGLDANLVTVALDAGGTRLEFTHRDGKDIQTAVGGADPAETDLGIQNVTVASPLTATPVRPSIYGQPSGNLDFTLTIDGAAVPVTVGDDPGEDLTDNTSVGDLVDDINAALAADLAAAGLGADAVIASHEDNRIRFTADPYAGIESLVLRVRKTIR